MANYFNNTNYGVPYTGCEYWFCNCQILKFCKNALPFVILFFLLGILGYGFADVIVWLIYGAMKIVGVVLATVTKVMMVPIFIFPVEKATQVSEQPPVSTPPPPPLPPSVQFPTFPIPSYEPNVDTIAAFTAVDISTVKEEVLRLEKCFLEEFFRSESETRSMFNVLLERLDDIESRVDSQFGEVNYKIWEVKVDILDIKLYLKELLKIVNNVAGYNCEIAISEHFEKEVVFPCPSVHCPPNTYPSAKAFVMRQRRVVSKCVV